MYYISGWALVSTYRRAIRGSISIHGGLQKTKTKVTVMLSLRRAKRRAKNVWAKSSGFGRNLTKGAKTPPLLKLLWEQDKQSSVSIFYTRFTSEMASSLLLFSFPHTFRGVHPHSSFVLSLKRFVTKEVSPPRRNSIAQKNYLRKKNAYRGGYGGYPPVGC